jgi:hypothetical protein
LNEPPRNTRLNDRRPAEGVLGEQPPPQAFGIGLPGVAGPARNAAPHVAPVNLPPGVTPFRLEAERIKLGQGRPIETLDSFRQLLQSRLELSRAIVAFDVAQFQLFVALGSNPETAPGMENGLGSYMPLLPGCQPAH